MTVAADYITLQRVIADELGDRMDLMAELADTGLASSPIKRAITSAIAKWEREQFYFNEEYTQPLFSTVAGQELYGAAAAAAIASSPDIWSLHVLMNGNRDPLERRSWSDLEMISSNPADRGQPREWAYLGSQIRLYPIPDAIYPVRATRTARLAALSADGASNAWTTEAFDLIRCEAKLILARDVLHDEMLQSECTQAIYGNPLNPRDKGYYGALKAETMRRARSRIKPTQF